MSEKQYKIIQQETLQSLTPEQRLEALFSGISLYLSLRSTLKLTMTLQIGILVGARTEDRYMLREAAWSSSVETISLLARDYVEWKIDCENGGYRTPPGNLKRAMQKILMMLGKSHKLNE